MFFFVYWYYIPTMTTRWSSLPSILYACINMYVCMHPFVYICVRMNVFICVSYCIFVSDCIHVEAHIPTMPRRWSRVPLRLYACTYLACTYVCIMCSFVYRCCAYVEAHIPTMTTRREIMPLILYARVYPCVYVCIYSIVHRFCAYVEAHIPSMTTRNISMHVCISVFICVPFLYIRRGTHTNEAVISAFDMVCIYICMHAYIYICVHVNVVTVHV